MGVSIAQFAAATNEFAERFPCHACGGRLTPEAIVAELECGILLCQRCAFIETMYYAGNDEYAIGDPNEETLARIMGSWVGPTIALRQKLIRMTEWMRPMPPPDYDPVTVGFKACSPPPAPNCRCELKPRCKPSVVKRCSDAARSRSTYISRRRTSKCP